MKASLTFLLACCLLFLNGQAEEIPVVKKNAINVDMALYLPALSLQELKRLNTNGVEVIEYPGTVIPLEIIGVFTTGLIMSAEDAVLSLTSVRKLMQIEAFEFALIEKDDDRLDRCVYVLQQLHNGVPVYNSTAQIVTGFDGTPMSVRVNYQRGLDLSVVPKMSAQEAASMLPVGRGERILEAELFVYAMPGVEPSLCWRYNIDAANIVNSRYVFLSASTGEQVAIVPHVIV